MQLLGFQEAVRADIVAITRHLSDPWILAFEVKEPSPKWELKNWLAAFAQAGAYPNCYLNDKRAGEQNGFLVNAAFVYPEPNLEPWGHLDRREARFFRQHDFAEIRGAKLLAQYFKVGVVSSKDGARKVSLVLGTDSVWDSRDGFRQKASTRLGRRKIGSMNRAVGIRH